MKYRYKDTDTVVESSAVLDSVTFTPVEEKKSAAKRQQQRRPEQTEKR